MTLSKVCGLSKANNKNDQITGADINGDTMVYRGYHYVSKFDMSSIRNGQCKEQGPISGLSNDYESSDLREAVAFEGVGGDILTVSESCRSYSGQLDVESAMPDSSVPNFNEDIGSASAYDVSVNSGLESNFVSPQDENSDAVTPSSAGPDYESQSDSSSMSGGCPNWIRFCWDWQNFKWQALGAETEGYSCQCGIWKKI